LDHLVNDRARRSRSTPTGNTDGEFTEASTNRRCELGDAVCVNPWDVEHQPNPVIFSHLSCSVKATLEQTIEDSTAFAPSLKALPSSREVIGLLHPNLDSVEKISNLHAPFTTLDFDTLMTRQASDIESSDDTVPTLESSISEFPADNISPVTTSEGTPDSKGKERCVDHVGPVELINFAAAIPSSSNYDNNLSSGPPPCADNGIIASASRASSLSSPPKASSPANVSVSPSVLTKANGDSTYPCANCHLDFQTPGLRRYVILTRTETSRIMLRQGAVVPIKILNTPADILANYATQDSPSERT